MVIMENEQLFLDLTVFDSLSNERINELRDAGYLDSDCDNTEKAESYIADFVDSRSDEVITILEQQGSYFKDKGRVMYHAGIKNPMAMDFVMERLSNQMMIKRKRNGDYIKRNGINTP